MLCDRCSIYIDVKNLAYHKAYHEALQIMKYQFPHKPTDVVTLLHRRNMLVRRIKTDITPEKPLYMQDVTKIDDAYELLKNDLEDVYEEIKQIREKPDVSVKGVSLNCSPGCALAVGMCSSENRRWKSYMEDTKVYQDYFGEDRNKCYLALFDGYHGLSAAERSACELHHLLLSEMSKFDSLTKSTTARNFAESAAARTDYELLRPETRDSFRVNIHQDSTEIIQGILDVCYAKYDSMNKDKTDKDDVKTKKKDLKNPISEKMQQAFKKTYHLMDILLSYGKDERSKVRWSGTSALTVVIQNTKSEKGSEEEKRLASLEEEASGSEGPRNSAKPKSLEPPEEHGLIHLANAGNTRCILVRDNKPYRLSKDHTPNNPKERSRILKYGGNLSSSERDSRVNGVLSVTRGLGNHGDKKLKDCVIVDPHVSTKPIDQYAQFLVLASKGVWEVFSDEEVASLMTKMLPSQQIPPPPLMNETLLSLFEEDKREGSKNSELIENAKSTARSQEFQQPPYTMPRSSRVSFSEAREKTNSSNGGADLRGEKDSFEGINMTSTSNDNQETVDITDPAEAYPKQTKNVLADLHTEIGSRLSEGGWDDMSLRTDTNHGLEVQYFTVEEHSNFQEKAPKTPEEMRRELAKSMAETLTQAALMAKAKDNITCMVVLLPGCGL